MRSSPKIFLVCAGIFFVLSAFVLFLWFRLPSETNVRTYLLFALFTLVAMTVVIVYQALKIRESAEILAQRLTSKMFTSSRELFFELYRSSPVPYFILEENGKIVSMNMSAVRLFKVTQSELEGQNAFSYIEGKDETRTAMLPELFKKRLFINDEEVTIHLTDGSHRYALMSLFSFTDLKSDFRGLLTLVDITKQKEVDKAKTEFVSLASHQMRTPIATMKWNLELLMMKNKDSFTPDQQSYVEKVARNLSRMDMLIEDFLNVSRFELGTLVAEPKQFEWKTFIKEILQEQAGKIKSKELVVREEYDTNIVTLKTDDHMLRMAIGNLISNAVKYTPQKGEIAIAFSAAPTSHIITIKDTGMGIPLVDQDKIFSKVFRAGNARKNVPDGTGLGLYIVREALKVIGGTVTFTSQENRGTTFTVTLPR